MSGPVISLTFSYHSLPSHHTLHTDSQFKLRAFALPVPSAWTSLPPDSDLPFKSLLKSHLFNEVYPNYPIYYNKLSPPPRTPFSIYPALGTPVS